MVGNSEIAERAGDSLTLKLTAAYSRTTGRCRFILLGVRFREKVRGECKEGKDREPIAIPAASTRVFPYIEATAGYSRGWFPGAGTGRAG